MKKELSALDAAIKYIGYKERTSAEVIIKLQGLGYNQDEIEDAIIRLKENLLLDDSRFAFDLAECLRRRGTSRKKAIQTLKAKKLDEALINEAMQSFTDEGEQEAAEHEALSYVRRIKKCTGNGFEYSNKDCKRCMEKTLRRLVSQGFDFDTAKTAARRACEQLSSE